VSTFQVVFFHFRFGENFDSDFEFCVFVISEFDFSVCALTDGAKDAIVANYFLTRVFGVDVEKVHVGALDATRVERLGGNVRKM
jgi:hypothetical protein